MTPGERAELRRMGERLIALADGDAADGAQPNRDLLLDAARREISRRESRKRVVPGELLGEPAWDILLDLFVKLAMGKRVGGTSSSIAGDVPPTTSWRWITALVDGGYAVREPDPADARRSFVRLSRKGRDMVAEAMRISADAEHLTGEAAKPRSARESGLHEELADELNIAPPTVEMHRANMIGKLSRVSRR